MYSRYLYVYQCVHYFAWSYIAVLMLYRKYYINKFDLKDLIWNSIAKWLFLVCREVWKCGSHDMLSNNDIEVKQ